MHNRLARARQSGTILCMRAFLLSFVAFLICGHLNLAQWGLAAPASPRAAAMAPARAETPPAKATAELEQRLAEAERRNAELRYERDIEKIHADLIDRQTSWFEILIAMLALIVSALVIYFTIRFGKTAVAEAKEGIAKERAEIEKLLAQARDATEAAQAQFAAINNQIEALRSTAEQASSAAETAAQKAGEATRLAEEKAAEATTHAERTRLAAEIVDRQAGASSRESKRDEAKLSAQEEQLVEAAAEGLADKPEKDWTIEEFKTRIGKAIYVDGDWDEAIRLARFMVSIHGEDDGAFAFAKNSEGHALRFQERNADALTAYSAVKARLGVNPEEPLQQELTIAWHNIGYCLAEFNRAEEAEAEFRALLPIFERVSGVEDSETLVTRHALASAILDQGRAEEAEAEFRALLPICERVDGPADRGTLVTRYWYAAAQVATGNAEGAKASLLSIPYPDTVQGWHEASSANFCFVWARVCDALNEGDDATQWLGRAARHYAAAYPSDHHYRRQFDDYVASRLT